MVKDIARQFPGRLLGLFVLSVIAVASRVLVFGILLAYLHLQESPNAESLDIMGLTLPIPLGANDDGLFLVLLLVAGLGAAFAQFWESWLRIEVGREYALRSIGRTVDIFVAAARRGVTPTVGGGDDKLVERLLGGDAAIVTRLVVPIASMMLPLVQALVFGGLLFVTNARLTLVLSSAAILYVVPYFFATRVAVRAAHRREDLNPQVRRELRPYVRRLQDPHYAAGLGPRIRKDLLASPRLRESLKTQQSMILNRERVGLVNNLFIAFLLALLLGMSGSGLTGGNNGWTDLLGYAVVLRQTFGALQQVTIRFATFNRFSPQMGRLVGFYRANAAFENAEEPYQAPSHRPKDLTVRVGDTWVPDGAGEVVLRTGHPLRVIDPFGRPRPLTIASWWTKIVGSAGRGVLPMLVDDPDDVPRLGLVQLATGEDVPSPDQRAEAEAFFASAGFGSLPVEAHQLTPELAASLVVAPAVLEEAPIVVIGARVFTDVDEDTQERLLAMLSESVVILHDTSLSLRSHDCVDAVALVDENGVIGVGDTAWWQAVQHDLVPTMRQRVKEYKRGRAGGFGDDDDSDIDDE